MPMFAPMSMKTSPALTSESIHSIVPCSFTQSESGRWPSNGVSQT